MFFRSLEHRHQTQIPQTIHKSRLHTSCNKRMRHTLNDAPRYHSFSFSELWRIHSHVVYRSVHVYAVTNAAVRKTRCSSARCSRGGSAEGRQRGVLLPKVSLSTSRLPHSSSIHTLFGIFAVQTKTCLPRPACRGMTPTTPKPIRSIMYLSLRQIPAVPTSDFTRIVQNVRQYRVRTANHHAYCVDLGRARSPQTPPFHRC